jgi:uncharacterized repeat protein (TIGR04138 family)
MAVSPDDDKTKIMAEPALSSDYPVEAYEFVQTGLRYTAAKIHGQTLPADGQHHVRGQELCVGLREYALSRWGIMARTVLERWNITRTLDFGKIVFSLVDAGRLGVTDEDTLDDFRNVYDFSTFESSYHIQSRL